VTATPVLQVVTSTDRRGAETFAVDLGGCLRERGFEVETVALHRGEGSGLDLSALGMSPLAPSTLAALRSRAPRGGVVIAHGSTTLPACAIALAALRTPFVYRNIGDPTYWADSPSRRWRTTALLSRARAVAALSPRAADTLRTRHHVRADRVRVIPTGVSAQKFRPASTAERHDARTQFGAPVDGYVAGIVGALSPEKAVDIAIAAVAATPEVDHLLIAGDGPERARLESLAATSAPGRVTFLGSRSDPGAVYAAVDTLLLTSLTEGLPAALIEAGLAGVPVVATDVGYVRDIVVDGTTGVLVAPRDVAAVARALVRVRELPPAGAERARQHCIEHFELALIADRWATLIREVTA